MTILTESSLASMHVTVSWNSDTVQHMEHFHAADVNMWRDIFPEPVKDRLYGSRLGDVVSHSFKASEITGTDSSYPLSLPLHHWQPPTKNNMLLQPMAGRYYPQGFLHGVAGVYPQTVTPMRVVSSSADSFTVDLNHPLNSRQIEVMIRLEDVSQPRIERGGRCSDRLMDVLENGPGMQARIATNPITFDRNTAYERFDPGNDKLFYAAPRMVSHIDSQAKEHLTSIVSRLLQPGNKVLDLMASVDSHLPPDHDMEVTGIGMNRKEMAANRDLTEYMTYDLNEDPTLPFPDRSFDAVVCNLSIEYLIMPEEVIRETARVLKRSGIFLVSFSNRWFPPKVTRLWTELHEFERMGYVVQLCWPYYDMLHTYSYRNWPRPISDKHFPAITLSDPLYVVSGRARA